MVALTESLVFAKTKADSLGTVRNLNLWGHDLTDVSIVRQMPNAEVLSLSVNKICTLEDFAFCPKLSELYLRKNEVPDVQDILYLKGLKHLKILWLCDNPCAKNPKYREFAIAHLSNLTKLDNEDITPEERARVAKLGLGHEDKPRPMPSADDGRGGGGGGVVGALGEAVEAAYAAQTGKSVMVDNRRGSSSLPERSGGKSSNVLYAVLALLNELDNEGLDIVKAEIGRVMSARK
eukprot:GFYU01007925.1.p1 GENE.GFYU01007925.1~~GFYU01007925.1.p1  ORF type:complete len:235 (-),score=44.50 GFYU01007925.1:121-825(-)